MILNCASACALIWADYRLYLSKVQAPLHLRRISQRPLQWMWRNGDPGKLTGTPAEMPRGAHPYQGAR